MDIKKCICVFLAVMLLLTAGGCTQNNTKTPEATQPPRPTQQTTEPTTQPEDVTIPSNPYGPLDFAYEGEYMVCLEGESKVGVDVSAWQGEIDWQQVADAGIEFAIIRIAWRGTEEGQLYVDEYAERNYLGATAAGIQVGGYVFSQAINVREAKEEADFLLDVVKDWQLQMPLVFDWEFVDDQSRTADMDARTLTDCYKVFCETVKAAGYRPMIYFNPEQAWRKMFLEELIDYEFWLAMYERSMLYPYKIHMWQYTPSGTVPGIEGPVDLNIYFEYEEG